MPVLVVCYIAAGREASGAERAASTPERGAHGHGRGELRGGEQAAPRQLLGLPEVEPLPGAVPVRVVN